VGLRNEEFDRMEGSVVQAGCMFQRESMKKTNQ
jgi:hypothetical protein